MRCGPEHAAVQGFVEEFGILGFRVLGSWFGNVG